jgi:hypothetical protein
MHKLLIGLCALATVEAPALACFCAGPFGEQQKREFAHSMARNVVALAEVIQIEEMDLGSMRPERYRVLRTIVGKAPVTFFAATDFERHSSGLVAVPMSDCDASPGEGERRIVALYPPRQQGDTGMPLSDRENRARIAAARKEGTLEFGSMCDHLFLNTKGVVELVRREAGKLRRSVN